MSIKSLLQLDSKYAFLVYQSLVIQMCSLCVFEVLSILNRIL